MYNIPETISDNTKATSYHETDRWKKTLRILDGITEKLISDTTFHENKIEKQPVNTEIKSDSTEECKLKLFLRDLSDPKLDNVPNRIVKKPLINQQRFKRTTTKKERPFSIAATPTSDEKFRQQMYNEYVNKVMEREERKQHHIIKISNHENLPKKRRTKKRLGNLNKVEQEFIEKAKKRLNKYGIDLDDSDGGCSSGNELSNSSIMMDGRKIKDAKNLPKHLQEFLNLSTAENEEDKVNGEIFC